MDNHKQFDEESAPNAEIKASNQPLEKTSEEHRDLTILRPPSPTSSRGADMSLRVASPSNGYGCDQSLPDHRDHGPYEDGDQDSIHARSMSLAKKWVTVIIVGTGSLCV